MSDHNRDVLIVDDSAVFRAALAAQLTTLGYLVDEASNGRAGLAKVNSHRYHLVITDYLMPGMDGMQFAEAVKSVATTPVILVSGLSTRDLAKLPVTTSVDAILDKPITVDQLTSAIEGVFRTESSPCR